MTPEALRRRMAHGNIYDAEKVDAALAHYFRAGNLGTLRELALLWVADRVDEGLEEYRSRHGITEPWETRERVVVALTGAPGRRPAHPSRRTHGGPSARGPRRRARADVGRPRERGRGPPRSPPCAARRARRALRRGHWHRHCRGSRSLRRSGERHAARLGCLRTLPLGGAHPRLGDQPGAAPVRSDRRARHLDVAPRRHPPAPEPRRRSDVPRSPRARAIGWFAAFVAIPVVVLILLPFKESIGVPGLLLLLLLGPTAVAIIGGLAPALAASGVAFVLADWFYIEPTQSMRFAHAGDTLALVVFVAVSALVSGLVDLLARRRQPSSREARQRPRRSPSSRPGPRCSTVRRCTGSQVSFGSRSASTPSRCWHPHPPVGQSRPLRVSPFPTHPTGRPTPPSSRVGRCSSCKAPRFRPKIAASCRRSSPTSGWLSTPSGSRRLPSKPVRWPKQIACAKRFSPRCPTICAARSPTSRRPATSLLSEDVEWPVEEIRSFCKTIDGEADRLHAVVTNLLDMGRLQAGMLGVRNQEVILEEVVFSALASLSVDVSTVDVEVPADLPLVVADPALLERALANVVQNALSWAPEGTRVRRRGRTRWRQGRPPHHRPRHGDPSRSEGGRVPTVPAPR